MNELVTRYGKEKRFVAWKLESRNGKSTKVPYTASGQMASSTDPGTWSTHEEILKRGSKVGIVLHDEKLLGIDIDHVLSHGELSGEHAKRVQALLLAADTYCEVSPSGTGLHLFLELTDPLKLEANRHAPFEFYTSGRYLTLTGIPYLAPRPLRIVSAADAKEILQSIGWPWKKEKPVGESLPPVQNPISVSDVLERMFASQHGAAIRKLYEGDLTLHENDHSRADMALLTHLAFWTGKNETQMEQIWMNSPLGKRSKTINREDYRRRSIRVAVENTDQIYNPELRGASTIKINDPKLNLLYAVKDKSRLYYKNTENIVRLLSNHPEFVDTLRFDEYRNIIERKVHGRWRDLDDVDAVIVQTRISVLFSEFANIDKMKVYDAMVKVAYDHRIDSGGDYVRSLVWDKESRLDQWLSKAYHVENNEYHKTIGANWIKGLVKRIIEPGSKFDYVLVLEGAQGIRKSTSLLALAGNLGHVETTMSTETKDFFMQFLGNAIVEFSEGETLSRTEVKRMKALITVQIDKFRQPYGRAVIPHPRRCVFAMTTNQSEYLKDETGNRRWLPVEVVGDVDIDWIKENREQILAEAYARVMAGEKTYEFPQQEMERQQNMRRIHDPNDERITNWYFSLAESKRAEGVSISDAFQFALNGGFMTRPLTRSEEMSITDVFRTTLFLERKRGLLGGVRITRWYPTPQTVGILPQMAETF